MIYPVKDICGGNGTNNKGSIMEISHRYQK